MGPNVIAIILSAESRVRVPSGCSLSSSCCQGVSDAALGEGEAGDVPEQATTSAAASKTRAR